MALYDTMQLIKPDVAIICLGMAASMGAVLLCAGAKGKRACLPHSRVLIHQPMGGTQGQATDILIAAKEIEKTRNELVSIFSSHTSTPDAKILTDIDRDYWMSAEEAKDYGIVDKVMSKSTWEEKQRLEVTVRPLSRSCSKTLCFRFLRKMTTFGLKNR